MDPISANNPKYTHEDIHTYTHHCQMEYKEKISEAARENGHTIYRWQYEFKLISHQNYGGWEEGIVREFGMNMYTLLHFK